VQRHKHSQPWVKSVEVIPFVWGNTSVIPTSIIAEAQDASVLRVLVLSLTISCLGSFTWALRSLFQKGRSLPATMRAIVWISCVLALWHIQALATRTMHSSHALAGSGLCCAALVLFWWAVPYARGARLAVAFESTTSVVLLNKGPYRYIRHPFYVCYILFWISGAVATADVILLLSPVIMSGFYAFAIRREEAELLARGELPGYAAYRRSTGCIIPRWRAWRRD